MNALFLTKGTISTRFVIAVFALSIFAIASLSVNAQTATTMTGTAKKGDNQKIYVEKEENFDRGFDRYGQYCGRHARDRQNENR